jgi:hypothetical protein
MQMGKAYLPLYANISDEPLTVFILHHSAVGGIKSSWRGNRIETGKNLNPVQKILGGRWNFWGKFPPPKDA